MDGSDEDASSSSEDKLKEENNEEDFEEDLEQQHFLEPQVRVAPILFRSIYNKRQINSWNWFMTVFHKINFGKFDVIWLFFDLQIFDVEFIFIGDHKTRRYLSVMRRSLKVTLSRPTLWIIWNFQFGTFSVWRRSQRKFFRQQTSFLVQVYYLQLKKSI